MKFFGIKFCFIVLLVFLFTSFVTSTSYLKIDIIDAVNLHCKRNNELFCNPYAIIEFKLSETSKTTKIINCTKNPKWDTSFSFNPEFCEDVIKVHIFQYLDPRSEAFIGNAQLSSDDNLEKGFNKPGYLGSLNLELSKLPFGVIDDWFMLDTEIDNDRVMFPSCIHLRIAYSSTSCNQPYQIYQINSLKTDNKLVNFHPNYYLPMCKKDFIKVYKFKYSKLGSESENNVNNNVIADDNTCIKDINLDYGFDHSLSNLTSIEEALVFKIVKRTSGEVIDYNKLLTGEDSFMLTNNYKEFFEKECNVKHDLSIERINLMLKNDVEEKPLLSTNPYFNPDLSKLNYPINQMLKRKEKVYEDTVNQFNAIEDLKNVDKMDDESYLKTVNRISSLVRRINSQMKQCLKARIKFL